MDEGLDSYGIVTIGDNPFIGRITIPENKLIENANVRGDVGIPNDITSLGDMTIWETSFLNVITETITDQNWASEKTFKPIIGKRPFVIVNNNNDIARLQRWGFKTFSDYWDEDSPAVEIIKKVCSMSDKEVTDMYNDMLPILEHNHNHFFTEYQKFNNDQFRSLKP